MAISIPGLNLSILRQETTVAAGRPLLISGRFTALGVGLPAFIRVTLEGPSYDPQLRSFDTFASPFSGDYAVNVIAEKDGQFSVFAQAFPPPLLPTGPPFPEPLLLPPPFAESARPPLAVGFPVEGGVDALLPDGTRRFLPAPPQQPIEITPIITVGAPGVTVTVPGVGAVPRLFPFPLPPAESAPPGLPGGPLPVEPAPEIAVAPPAVSAVIDDITFAPDSVDPGQEAIGRMAWRNTGEARQHFHISVYLVDRFGSRFGPLQVNQMVAAPPQALMIQNLRLSTLGLLPGVYGALAELHDPTTGRRVASQLVAQRLAILDVAPVEVPGVSLPPVLPPGVPEAEAPTLPTADMLLLPMLDAPQAVELGQTWQGNVDVGTTWPARLPVPAALPSYPVNVVIEVESPAGSRSLVRRAQPSFIPEQTISVPFNLATGNLPETGTYQVLANITDLQGNRLFSNAVGFLQVLAVPAPPPPEVPLPPVEPPPPPEAVLPSQFTGIEVRLGPSEVQVGDVLTIPVAYSHQGDAETVTLYAAIGNSGAFGFDEVLSARKTITAPFSARSTTHAETLDIPIAARLARGTYDVYAKIILGSFREVISAPVQNVVTVPVAPPLPARSQFSDVSALISSTTILLGETVEIPVWVVHQGAAETKELYAAIGTKGIFFNEHTAGKKLVSFRQDDSPNSYIENVAVPIPAGMTPGTYDVYAKVLLSTPLQISPVVKNVIEVRSAAEQYTLTVRQEPEVGSVETSPEKMAYNRLEVVVLTARLLVPENRQWEFDRWEINGSPRSYNPASVVMVRDLEAVVFYRRK